MRKRNIVLVLIVGFILVACGRSKDPDFYVLNPISSKKSSTNVYAYLRIGIDKVSMPDYIEKPQLAINYTPHRLGLEEKNQWAEGLDKNTMRVIVANLSTLLPGAVVNSSPWDSNYKPTYHLQINIIQFTIDIYGNSLLNAQYIIYEDEKLISKRNSYHHQKVPVVTTENLVISMNNNLTGLTRDIARYFAHNT